MSQDIFRQLEDVDEGSSESEDDPAPIQSSGVSGSVSPLSQPAKAPVAPGDASNELICTLTEACRKKKYVYKTKRGYDRHMAEKHPTIPGAPASAPGSDAVAASSVSTPQGGSSDAATGYICPVCQKKYKSQARFVNHQASHALDVANVKKPSLDDFRQVQEDIVGNILQEMLTEPKYSEEGEIKSKFLEDFVTAGGVLSEFMNQLSSVICDLVCKRQKKLFPMNQYEEAHSNLNNYLCDSDCFKTLQSCFHQVCESKISDVMANRLICRIAFKLLNAIQCWVTSSMKKQVERVISHQASQPSEIQDKAFQITLGNIFRAYYKKGRKSRSKLWQSQAACLVDKFVVGPSEISSSVFLNKANWFSGDADSIQPDESALVFFKSVERIIQQSAGSEVLTSKDISAQVLQNDNLLNVWYFLTNAHFSEEDSIRFMKELLYSFVSVSTRLHEAQKNRGEGKSVRESAVPLRTHLQKNYSDKELSSDPVE